jgi:hypothetical protein
VGVGAAAPADAMFAVGTASAFKVDSSGNLTVPQITFSPLTGDSSPVITARTIPAGQGASFERTELILFHGNDGTANSGSDTITLRAPLIRLQTYNNAAVGDINNNAGSNDRFVVDPDGKIACPMWRVTRVVDNWAPSATINSSTTIGSWSFSSGGGTLLVLAAGSAWGAQDTMFGLKVWIDSTSGYLQKMWANQGGVHHALPSTPMVFTGIAAGSHTISFATLANTACDFNDRFSITVVEFPF